MRSFRLAEALRRRRPPRMRGLSRWRDELRELDDLLARQPDGPLAWFWRIRRKVLAFLVADRPLPSADAAIAIIPEPARAAAGGWSRAASAAPGRTIYPPPGLVRRMHGTLRDLAAANEARYAAWRQAEEAACLELHARRRADEIRRCLAIVVPSWRSADVLAWPLQQDLKIGGLQRSLRHGAVEACPRCLRRLEDRGPGRCPHCGHHRIDVRLTLDDLTALVRERLGLPVDAVRADDELGDLLQRGATAERSRVGR